MKIVCEECQAVYKVENSKIPEGGTSFRCKRCSNVIRIAGTEDDAEKLSQADQAKSPDTGSSSVGKQKKAEATNQAGSGSFRKGRDVESEQSGGSAGTADNDYPPSKRKGNISSSKPKLIMTALVIALLVCIQIQPIRGLLFENFLFRTADRSAEKYIDESFKRAMIAYGAARAINGVISVLQGSDLSFSPAGVGVKVSVGEILDPVNDIVERFSWIMLASLLSLGIQKAMVEIGPWLSVSVLLTISLFCILLSMWLKNEWSQSFQTIAKKALLAAVVLKFAMPCVAFLNHQVYSGILEDQYKSEYENIQVQADQLKDMDLQEAPAADDGQVEKQSSGWWDKTKNMVSDTSDALKNLSSIKEKIATLNDKAEELTESIIRLSIVFILNTIVIPILFLWGLVHFARLLFGTGFGAGFENRIREKIFGSNRRESLGSGYAGAAADS